MDKLKVLIIDDDILRRRGIAEIVESTGLTSVSRSLSDLSLALEWSDHNVVQVVLLDALMGQEGLPDILKAIKKRNPAIEVILICDGSPRSGELTLIGLQKGALDFITVSPDSTINKEGLKNQLQVLFSQIMIKANSLRTNRQQCPQPLIAGQDRVPVCDKKRVEISQKFDHSRWNGADLVLIAASTGGPAALGRICSGLPPDFAVPILIVQHLPPEFTAIMVESLGRSSPIPLAAGQDQDIIEPRRIYIAPGGVHMLVGQGEFNRKNIRLREGPHVNAVRPSADVLFGSVAEAYRGSNVLAVVLTGMGIDGTAGVADLKDGCNCYCIVQSEKSCIVYGMPRSINEAGLADEAIDLDEIALRISRIAAGGFGKDR